MPPSDPSATVQPPLNLSVPESVFPLAGSRRSHPASSSETPASPRARLLHRRFEAQVVATPHAEALVFGHRRVTYRELNERANRVAHRLIGLGAGPDSLVGVYLERNVDLVAALLGVLKAGAAYMPLDPVYPSARLAFILKDAAPSVVLTQASSHDTLRRVAGSIDATPVCVCVDTDEQLAFARSDNPSAPVLPEHLAYVLYTPGVDNLKGVAIEHRNVASFVQWAGDLYGPGELSGVLACTSVCFDPSILELFVPLSFGGKIILADNILALDSLPAVDEIRFLDTSPSVARELLRIGGLPPFLETINLGGEPVSDRLVRQLHALPNLRRVYDQYGPIETTTTATSLLRVPGQPAALGDPVAGSRLRLLDPELRPVAPGAIGELCIGGANVARGYLNRPELTAQKFIPDPFSDEPGARLFRTGDLCRLRPDGRLDYIGRVDEHVRIDGRFVNLDEVEATLRAHPCVGEALVMLREDSPGHARLVAYVAPRTPSAAGTVAPQPAPLSDLARYLKARLPHHLLPVVFALLAFLTVISNGRAERISIHAAARLRVTDYSVSYRNSRNRADTVLARLRRNLFGFMSEAALSSSSTRFAVTASAFTVRTLDLILDIPPARGSLGRRVNASLRSPVVRLPRSAMTARFLERGGVNALTVPS